MKKVATAVSLVALATYFASAAHAQTTQPAPAPAPSAGAGAASAPPAAAADTVNPAEIIVTATRREQSLQKVPIAVTALSAGALANSRINSSGGLDQLVLNLTSIAAVGTQVFFLRGVGQLSTNQGRNLRSRLISTASISQPCSVR